MVYPPADSASPPLAMATETLAVFSDYPPDFFDFIIVDECHRSGANDESTWRGILDYFAPAVQMDMIATPKRDENNDTYRYFGDPVYVYIYSLKDHYPPLILHQPHSWLHPRKGGAEVCLFTSF